MINEAVDASLAHLQSSVAWAQTAPMPLAALIRDGFVDALAHGGGGLDWSALAEVAARRANLDERRL